MKSLMRRSISGACAVLMAAFFCWPVVSLAEEPITLENLPALEPNKADEALAAEFSVAAAARFLDSSSLHWQQEKNCMTCHTNFAYLMARPAISANVPAHAAVREYTENLVNERWESNGPRWDAEVVMAAAMLACNDALTTGQLHPASRKALDRIWTVQREDGGFDWIKCDWPPMESDDFFGAAMAAIAAGIAPDEYAKTPAAAAGLGKLKAYLANTPAPHLHHKALLVWACKYLPDLIPAAEQQACVGELLKLQKEDGGWGLATLGDWKRKDGSPQDTASSDGYGTGLVVYVLRQSGLPATDVRVARGVQWLKSHQRASGRWFTRSLFQDNHHYLSHAGTAYAVMALGSCDEFKPIAATDVENTTAAVNP
ncbi:MAG: squalene--hopene cyclase [Pirellulales bacterium]